MTELRRENSTPKALNASSPATLRPIWNYDEHFDREADRKCFLEKHGKTATPEELAAEREAQELDALRKRISGYRLCGMSWREIGLKIGMDRDKARSIHDPEWGRQELAKRARNSRERYHRKKEAA